MKSLRISVFRKPWILIIGGILLVAVVGVIALRPIVSAKIEQALTEQLERRGLKTTWKDSSWDPWRGQHFTGLKIFESGEKNVIIAEIASISFRPSVALYFGNKDGSLDCSLDSAPLLLRDKVGKVVMDDVSLSMTVSKGKVAINNLRIERDGLTLDLTGELLLPPPLDKPREFQPNLKVFRTIFAALDVKGDTGSFVVKGDFSTDFRKSPIAWNADLAGSGDTIEWKGVRWTDAKAKGELSSEGAEITYNLTSDYGSTKGAVTQSGGRDEPFLIYGKVSDSSGRSDEYHAELLKGNVTVRLLKGSADLWELSKDVPAFTAERPENIRFTTFPHVEVKHLNVRTEGGERSMTVKSIAIDSPEPVEIVVDEHAIKATDFSAQGSYDGKNWIVQDSRAGVLGGNVNLSGSYRDGVMRNARIGIEDIKVVEVRRIFGGGGGKSSGRLTGNFKGVIEPGTKDWVGSGTIKMTDAPVVQVPLLDQAYELFTSVIPGLDKEKDGEFEADFKATSDIVDVTRFEAKGGKSLTVSAVGEIDLHKMRVQGRARGKLVGLPGVVTSPLSRLLEMEVSGPYDDIRVKPLGPAKLASATVSGTVGDVVETLEETGKITGTVIKEGLKLPFKWMKQDDEETEK